MKLRFPTEFGSQLGRVDRVSHVVPGAIGDQSNASAGWPSSAEHQTDDRLVVDLAVGTDQIRLALAATFDDGEHCE